MLPCYGSLDRLSNRQTTRVQITAQKCREGKVILMGAGNTCAVCGIKRVAYKRNRCKYCKKAHGGICDVTGKDRANNLIWNPIKNPKNNAKKQKRARDEATVRIAKMSKSEPVLTRADAKKKAAEIMLNVGLDGISYEELLGLVLNESASNTKRRFEVGAVGSFYIGYTARQLDEECLRWLTTRGARKQAEDGTFVDPTKRNRPVLLWDDGSTITMGKARKELGFDRVEVYASTLKINARAVEDALQYRYQHLPLGIRLWRCPDKGSKFDKVVDGKLHKVFITYSHVIAQKLAAHKIKIDK